jgi:hypothetical protein
MPSPPSTVERRVVAINDQYRIWVASRWGVELQGGAGFRAIHRLLGSAVEYRRMGAFEFNRLDERFELRVLLGILHRVENPLGLLRALRARTVCGGRALLEPSPGDRDGPSIRGSGLASSKNPSLVPGANDAGAPAADSGSGSRWR